MSAAIALFADAIRHNLYRESLNELFVYGQ